MVYTPSAQNLVSALRTQPLPPAYRRGTPVYDRQEPGQIARTLFQRNDGSIEEARHILPAMPVFTAAFSAFARGTLIATTRGPVAVEDLQPGIKVLTNERGPSPLLWIGSMSLRPAPTPGGPARLTRIMTGALGMGRPMVDLMTGPGARIAQRGTARPDHVLRPVHDLIDGNSVIAITPPGTVDLYHIALHRHATITAAGLTVETYHPGPGFEAGLNHQQLAQFLALFPHIRRPADFGSLAHPRSAFGQPNRQMA
ncbi:Hint domain-containing protein [Roseovarius dicentrarchi]|uniref:Hint domain-containing protein n=1 Tax=Roseovarius dicentrarchi TaxID=2250573 RepID=UPI000DE95F7F|nr:Hint domain-containing protein [Roseovarius dicentrarchi]